MSLSRRQLVALTKVERAGDYGMAACELHPMACGELVAAGLIRHTGNQLAPVASAVFTITTEGRAALAELEGAQ